MIRIIDCEAERIPNGINFVKGSHLGIKLRIGDRLWSVTYSKLRKRVYWRYVKIDKLAIAKLFENVKSD